MRWGSSLGRDPQALAVLIFWLGEALFWQNRWKERVHVGEEGLSLVADAADSLGAVLVYYTIAMGGSC